MEQLTFDDLAADSAPALCPCGCGGTPNPGRKFIIGHNTRLRDVPHGMQGTPTYHSWSNMIQRCTNPKHHKYANYGAKGITVCERWREFANFLADMGVRPEGKTLDRYPDNTGNYEPGNCRWATPAEQQRNRACVKLSPESVALIRSSPLSNITLGAQLGVTARTVGAVRRGVMWA